ncbi:hypothetical protein Sked_03400 [Sanguibacter keddieii DSM 10542]|uniref:Uncharacterized protein n=1 Tax=Sanguibacter keddieii (strain ATCC 51767 / DSM 10542 / NCFB 3025 / ST-74) TaxID=446469 RepID=D1BJQ1_SANKS|nr:hypothetical protein Sked_03400 [Sanguibacter keddieii DSM 10542]
MSTVEGAVTVREPAAATEVESSLPGAAPLGAASATEGTIPSATAVTTASSLDRQRRAEDDG